jgi:hypothetical protein
MPDKLPTFKPPWVATRKRGRAPDTNRPSATARGYCSPGWKAARREVLIRDNYQCRACGTLVSGKNAHVDHIVRKSDAPSDEIGGLQTLCASCHGRKTRREMQGTGDSTRYTMHPSWLKPSIIPVTLVCGPPAAGKNAYITQVRAPRDLVIDLDEIASSMARTTTHAWGLKWLGPAVRRRNALIATLATEAALVHGRAWLLVGEPLAERRQWWVDTLGRVEVVVVETPSEVCETRIATDPDRTRQGGMAREWWSAYTRRHGDTRVVGAARENP